MAFSGMNPDQVDSAASQLRTQAQELQYISARVSSLIDQAAKNWQGSDMSSFRSAWYGSYRGKMATAKSHLDSMASELNRQATDQRNTSAASTVSVALPPTLATALGGATVFPGVNGERNESWWDRFWDWILGRQPPSMEDVNQEATDNDAFDPNNSSQYGFGDCATVSSINALIESDAGDEIIRNNIRWDDHEGGYWVTLYIDGVAKEVFVDEVYVDGGGVRMIDENGNVTNKQGIVSLYEAAIASELGYDAIANGAWPEDRMNLITGGATQTFSSSGHGGTTSDDIGQATIDAFSDPNQTVVAVASTMGGNMPNGSVEVTVTRENGITEQVNLVGSHAYEVVGIDSQGRIGVRNPWGQGNGADGGGVIYLSPEDYKMYFTDLAVMEI